MKPLRRLQFFMAMVFIAQVAFTLASPFTALDNLYPAFSWRVFRILPEKFKTTRNIYIYSYNGQTFDPPALPAELATRARPVFLQRFALRGSEFLSWRDADALKTYVQFVNHTLAAQGARGRWQLREETFDIIEYFKTRKLLSSRVLGTYDY